MTPEEILELSTDELEAADDKRLLELLGPAIGRCGVLPGSEEEEREKKKEEKERKELEKEALLAAQPDGGNIVINFQKKKQKRTKKQTTDEKMKELLGTMAANGVDTKKLLEGLPKEMTFGKERML